MAFNEYSSLYSDILKYLGEVDIWRKVAKGAGWLTAILTGGIGLEDLIIVPAVNKILLSILKLDFDGLMSNLAYTLRQKLICVNLDPGLVDSVDSSIVYNDFLLCYKISYEQAKNQDRLIALFGLLNPVSNDMSIFRAGSKISITEVTDELLHQIELPGQKTEHSTAISSTTCMSRITASRLFITGSDKKATSADKG